MTAHAERREPAVRVPTDEDALEAWLAALPDVVAHLEAASHPRIADVGSGGGVRALAIARAFPSAWIDGFDTDPARVAAARRRAAKASLDGHVRFSVGDAGKLATAGPYDLVIMGGRHRVTPEHLVAVRAALRRCASVLVVGRADIGVTAAIGGFADVERVPGARALYRLRA